MEQLTLEINSCNKYRIEDFIISCSNKEIYEKILNWKNDWGVLPLKYACLIYGPPSSGKTFITKIFADTAKAFAINDLQDLNDEIFHKYPAFIIDNAEQFISQKLLHYLNLSNEYNKPILLTTNNKHLVFELPDLNSRIKSILKIELLPPDDELMKILLFKLFSTESIMLNFKVLNFVLNKLPREFNSIIKFADKINSYSLTHKRNITISMVKEILLSS